MFKNHFLFCMQGRAIETNLYAQMKCDSIKIGMVSFCSAIIFFILLAKSCHGYGAQLGCCFFSFLFVLQVKHPEVAQFLGGRLYDCVFKYNEVSNY